VPLLRRLVAGLSPQRPGFTPGSVYVGFVVDKVALGQVSSDFFGFSLSLSFHRVMFSQPPLVTLESRSPWLLGSWFHQLLKSSAGANTVYHGVSFSNIISCRHRLLLFVKHLALCIVRSSAEYHNTVCFSSACDHIVVCDFRLGVGVALALSSSMITSLKPEEFMKYDYNTVWIKASDVWLAFVNPVMNFWVPWTVGIYWLD
jgi:hypothetical protein